MSWAPNKCNCSCYQALYTPATQTEASDKMFSKQYVGTTPASARIRSRPAFTAQPTTSQRTSTGQGGVGTVQGYCCGGYREAETGQYSRRSVPRFVPCFHVFTGSREGTKDKTKATPNVCGKNQNIRVYIAECILCLYLYLMSSAALSRWLLGSYLPLSWWVQSSTEHVAIADRV